MKKLSVYYYNLKIGARLNGMVISVLVILSLAIGIAVNYQVTTSFKETAALKAKSDLPLAYAALNEKFPGEWKKSGDQLYKGDILVNENNEIVDYIANMTGGTVTIFLEDTRIVTNVMVDGKRAIGTQASQEVIDQTYKGGQNYYGSANVAGNQYQTAYQPIENASGSIIGMWYVGAPESMITSAITSIIKSLAITLTILSVISFFIVSVFTKGLTRRLNDLGTAMQKGGQGDFSQELTYVGNDEIALVAKSYNQMRQSISHLINKIQATSEQLASSAEELHASADETSRATDNIAQNVEEVAAASEQQSEKAIDLSDVINGMVSNITSIAESVTLVYQHAEKQAVAAKVGGENIYKTTKQVELINETTMAVSETINYLGDKSNEIGTIINLISEIAAQTNLLALNAAIEAARAGEHGRGFAVVAEEVRKLAEQSNQSANQIRSLVGEIQSGIENSVTSMDVGVAAIGEGLTLASQTETSFADIDTSIRNMRTEVEDVASSLDKMNIDTAKISEMIAMTVNMIQGTAHATQTVAAAAEEQNASMQEINAASQELTHLSEGMLDAVGQFKIN